MLSLKLQLSSMFLPNRYERYKDQDDYVQERVIREETPSKPTAVLIGTSNIDGIMADKLSSEVNITKSTAYTLEETKEVISDLNSKPDVVILHSLTNDIKTYTPNEYAIHFNKMEGC